MTGITTILGTRIALITADETQAAPGASRQESYLLSEGERDGGIEVVAIDERNGAVTVRNHGALERIDFAKNGVKPVASIPAEVRNLTRPVPPPLRPRQNASEALATQAQFQNRMPSEQQVLYIEAERMRLLQEGNREMADLLPPTEVTPEVLQHIETPGGQ